MIEYTLKELIGDEDVNQYFCRNRKTPIILNALVVELIQHLYENPAHLYKFVLPYSKDPKEENRTAIALAGTWSEYFKEDSSSMVVDHRPAIAVDLAAIKYDAKRHQGIDETSGFDLENGVSYHTRICNTSIEIKHLGSSKSQVLNYAANTQDLLDGFSDAIKRDFCLDFFRVSGILKARIRKKSPEDWECSVSIDIQYSESFGTFLESPKLKTTSIKANIN